MPEEGTSRSSSAAGAPPLAGLCVLDLATDRAELTGRVLADLGARVIKVEPPSGTPSRRRAPFANEDGESLYWTAVGSGKRSIVLDLDDRAGVESLRRLAGRSDVLIESFDPGWMASRGLGYEDLEPANPGLVYVSITPYGQDGPKSRWPATDLTAEAAGGLISLQGDGDRPPLPVGFPQAAFHAGTQAAADALVAVFERDRSGRGQHLDLSMQTAVIWTLMNATGFPPNVGSDPPGTCDTRDRPPPEIFPGLPAPPRVWPCADGYALFTPALGGIGARTLDSFVRWMEEEGALPEGLRGRDWTTWLTDLPEGRLTAADAAAVLEATGDFLLQRTKRELMDRAVSDSMLLSPIRSLPDVAADPQLKERSYWRTVDGVRRTGPFVRFGRTPLASTGRAPALGEHQHEAVASSSAAPAWPAVAPDRSGRERRPFSGVRVADFAWIGAGPMVTKQLADHGATVVHVESALRPDVLRLAQPSKDGVLGIDRSQFMANFNTSKVGLALNLTTDGGYELARKLVDWADIVVESFTPGTMKSFGLDWETLSAGRPDLIMMSSCLRGQTGPERTYAGFGAHGAALAGLHHITGWPDRPPDGPWGAYTDFIAPRYSLAALTAAMLERKRSGLGQYIDFSQIEAALHFMEPLLLDLFVNGVAAEADGDRSRESSPHGVFRSAGHERYIAIAVEHSRQWQALRRVAGIEGFGGPRFDDVAVRRESEEAIGKAIATWSSEVDAFEAERLLVEAGVPAAVVQRPSDLYDDPQLSHRDFFVPCEHSVMGPTPYDGPTSIYSATPPQLTAAPCLGEHTEYVLKEILGISEEQVIEYAARGCLE